MIYGKECIKDVKHFIYVDVYLMLNFILHLFFLMTTAFFRQKYQRMGRMVLASFVMAVFAVLLPFICFRFPYAGQLLVLPEQLFLLRLGFRYEGLRSFFKDFFVLAVIVCFSGGCISAFMHMFRGVIKKPSAILLFSAIFCLFLALFLLRMEMLSEMKLKRKKNIFHVKIVFRKEYIETKALYDTGNGLVSPYTGEGVILISEGAAKRLHPDKEKLLLIPYRSVGGNGVLEAFRVDSLEIKEKKEKREKVLAAISSSIEESSEFQVIM